MNKKIIISVACLALSPVSSVYADDGKLENDKDKYSYAVGSIVGEQLRQQFSSDPFVDFEVVLRGVMSASSQVEPLLSFKQMEEIVQKQQQEQLAVLEKITQEKQDTETTFLAENKKQEGVVVTDSGLQYLVIESGDDSQPKTVVTDSVVVHYKGTTIDGTVFDSSYDRGEPATFGLESIIPGWQEALQLMVPGDKWQVVIPSSLAYGENSVGSSIGPYETLIFDIELIDVNRSAN